MLVARTCLMSGLGVLLIIGLPFVSPAQSANEPDHGQVLSYNAATQSWTMSWWGRTGYTYFLQHSLDLKTWHNLDLIETGANAVISYGMTTSAQRNFWRISSVDLVSATPGTADFDGDGLTNQAELNLGTDPLKRDTDGDGLPDGWEVANNHDPLTPDMPTADSDGDGMPNAYELANGLNPNHAADGDSDADQDGIKARDEFAFGLNPTADDSHVPAKRTNYLYTANDELVDYRTPANGGRSYNPDPEGNLK